MADHARRDQESMYCHACHHQWQRNGESIECPACMSASTEIIDPENDPRHFHNRQPEQATVQSTEPAAAVAPGVPEPASAQSGQNANAAATTPSEAPNNNTQNPAGAANSGHGDAPHAASGHHPRVTFHFTAPQVTFFTFVTGNAAPPAPQSPPPPMTFFTMHFFPPAPPPTVNTSPTDPQPTNTTTSTQPGSAQPSHNQDQDHQTQNQQPPPIGPFPAGTPPTATATAFPGLPVNLLASLFTSLFNPAAAVHGDAVYTQEALDRIITQLREQVQPGGAPPASQAALDRLRMTEVDDKMLGIGGGHNGAGEDGGCEGKARCVVCVDDMVKGEKVAVLPCEHFFHGECVVPWLKLHGTCPVCRRSVEVEEKGVEGKAGGDVGVAEQGHQAGFEEGRSGGLGDAMDCS